MSALSQEEVALNKRAQKNIQIASELFALAYKIKKFQLKKNHPKLSEEELHQQTLELIEKACRR